MGRTSIHNAASLTVLTDSLVKHDGCGLREVETSDKVRSHRNLQEFAFIGLEERLGQPLGFTPKHKIGRGGQFRFRIRMASELTEEIQTFRLFLLQKGLPIGMNPDVYVGPIVESGPFYPGCVDLKSKRLHEMEDGACTSAEPSYRPRILGDYRFMQDNVEILVHGSQVTKKGG